MRPRVHERWSAPASVLVGLVLLVPAISVAEVEQAQTLALYLHRTTGAVPGIGGASNVLLMDSLVPNQPAPANLTLNATPTLWYMTPAALRTTALVGPFNLTVTVGSDASVNRVMNASLWGVARGGELRELGNASRQVQIQPQGLLGLPLVIGATPFSTANISFDLAANGTAVAAGETIAIGLSASDSPLGSQAPVGTITLIYDNSSFPANLTGPVRVRFTGAVDLAPTLFLQDVEPGEEATYTISVRNNGLDRDTIALSTGGSAAGWTVRLDTTSVTVDAGGASDVRLTVEAPASASPSTEDATTVTAPSSCGEQDTVTFTTTVRAADRDGDGVSDRDELAGCSNIQDRRSTPNTDDDGDGYTNREECSAGTDPRDGGSRPGGQNTRPPPTSEETAPAFLQDLHDSLGEPFGSDDGFFASAVPGSLKPVSGTIFLLLLLLLLITIVILLLALLRSRRDLALYFDPAKIKTEGGATVELSFVATNTADFEQRLTLAVPRTPEGVVARLPIESIAVPAKGSARGVITAALSHAVSGTVKVPLTANPVAKPDKVLEAKATLVVRRSATRPREVEAETEPATAPLSPPTTVAPAPGPAGAPDVVILSERTEPEVPVRESTVTTTVRVANQGTGIAYATGIALYVNGNLRAKKIIRLQPAEEKDVFFEWVAHLSRNEVRIAIEGV
ncbi:MAG: CARDB domain-containing protein [Methanobacteriota archaeon]